MPFGFGQKKTKDEAEPAVDGATLADARPPRKTRFDVFTEDWRLDGELELTGRLMDRLNQRESIAVTDVKWAPPDGSADLEPAPGIGSMDPYDLIIVVAGPDTLETRSDDERAAHRIHKVSFDVALEAPPYRVIGTIGLHPGSEPDSLMERGTNMFAAVTDPIVLFGGVALDLRGVDTVLVNRFYLRGVAQVDRATGEPHQRLPGQSLGGTNWRERS